MAKFKLPVLLIALILTGLALTFTTFAAVTISRPIGSQGAVKASANLGLFSDSQTVNTLSSLDWGTLNPGVTVTRTVFVKNTGTGVSLTLSLNSTNWDPISANGPIAVSWDREGTKLNPNQTMMATITLRVASNIIDITNFGVQIYITGTN
jgi:hypothetical protein